MSVAAPGYLSQVLLAVLPERVDRQVVVMLRIAANHLVQVVAILAPEADPMTRLIPDEHASHRHWFKALRGVRSTCEDVMFCKVILPMLQISP